jgi:transaldolase
MNTLEQLKTLSTVVADTGDIEAIKRFKPVDATTNPSLLLKASQLEGYQGLLQEAKAYASKNANGFDQAGLAADKLATLIGKEICQSVEGLVSTEIDARLSFDTKACIEKARLIIKLYEEIGIGKERILIKIAATWPGIQAAKVLELEGIRCNLTLIFCQEQAQAAADAGAYLISPFVGRITDWYKASMGVEHFSADEDPGVQSVKNIYKHYKSQGYNTIVMAASFRNTEQVLALAGCDKLTISPDLLNELNDKSDNIEAKLSSTASENVASGLEQNTIGEAEFAYQLNQNEMAHEKLAAGIRAFIADQVKLEEKLAAL